jgi:uncharacterized lipoprotein NlpE involved in copper resistance
MKKNVFILSIISLAFTLNACTSKGKEKAEAEKTELTAIDAAHNSQNSLDWAGIYTGTVPCADCEGIQVTITLNNDLTYEMSMEYLKEKRAKETFSGTFLWDASGSTITLGNIDEKTYPTHYIVGENILIQLDLEGNIITGELASNYILTKE